jgi:hypothetical protein
MSYQHYLPPINRGSSVLLVTLSAFSFIRYMPASKCQSWARAAFFMSAIEIRKLKEGLPNCIFRNRLQKCGLKNVAETATAYQYLQNWTSTLSHLSARSENKEIISNLKGLHYRILLRVLEVQKFNFEGLQLRIHDFCKICTTAIDLYVWIITEVRSKIVYTLYTHLCKIHSLVFQLFQCPSRYFLSTVLPSPFSSFDADFFQIYIS